VKYDRFRAVVDHRRFDPTVKALRTMGHDVVRDGL